MPYRCDIAPATDLVDADAWNEVLHNSAGESLFMELRFVRVVQQTASPPTPCWLAIVRDESGRPACIACLSALPLDLAQLAGGVVKQAAGYLRTVFANALNYSALFCGLPVSAGLSPMRFRDGADVAKSVASLAEGMTKLARAQKARFLICKEFDEAEAAAVTPLESLGFFRGESPPMNHFPTRFQSFDEYRANLKAPYRSKIVRSERKFKELDIRLERLAGGRLRPEQFTEEIYRMYLAVVEKSPIRLETLSREWFQQMAASFPQESVWTALYEQEKLLAWAYGLHSEGTYHSLFGGVDYGRNGETDAYFNLMYHELDHALRSGVSDIQLGQTADDYKGRLGATQTRRWFFVKPLKWKARWILNLAAEHVMPTYPPPVERHVFQASKTPSANQAKR